MSPIKQSAWFKSGSFNASTQATAVHGNKMAEINCWTDDGPCDHLNFVPISPTFDENSENIVESRTDPLTNEKTEITIEDVKACLLYFQNRGLGTGNIDCSNFMVHSDFIIMPTMPTKPTLQIQ